MENLATRERTAALVPSDRQGYRGVRERLEPGARRVTSERVNRDPEAPRDLLDPAPGTGRRSSTWRGRGPRTRVGRGAGVFRASRGLPALQGSLWLWGPTERWPSDLRDWMESPVCRVLLVLLGDPDPKRRETTGSSAFREQLEKSAPSKRPTYSPACFLTLLHPLRVLRVTSDCQAPWGKAGWRGFQVPWDQSDPLDPPGPRGPRPASVTGSGTDTRPTRTHLDSVAPLDLRARRASAVYLVGRVCRGTTETKDHRDPLDLLGFPVSTGSPECREPQEREERRVCRGET